MSVDRVKFARMIANTTIRNPWFAYLALGVVCVLWGTTFLALRIGVLDLPPFLFTAIRQGVAGLLLTGFLVLVLKVRLPSRKHMIHQALGGFLMVSIGNGLIGYAEVTVSSGIAAIICSMMPIWVILINLAVSEDERPTFPIIMGSLIGLSGIILIFGENLNEFSNPAYTWGIVLTFAANFGWAVGSTWIKKQNRNSNAFMDAGLQMFFGGILLLPVSAVFDDYARMEWTAAASYALVYLTLFGSILTYACYSYAIKKLPMTIVSLYAYVNPIVAVLLGSLLLDERFNLRMAVAMLVTIAGIYIVNRGYQVRNLWKAQFSR